MFDHFIVERSRKGNLCPDEILIPEVFLSPAIGLQFSSKGVAISQRV